jgi:hypothetical protein
MTPIQPYMVDQPPEPRTSQTIAHAIALLSEGLIEAHELPALAHVEAATVPDLLKSPDLLAAVQKATLLLRTSGEAARLEAARHARDAVTERVNHFETPGRMNLASKG